jgi:integrase
VGRRARAAFTARQIASTKKLGYTADSIQPGLNVQVSQGATGIARSWVFRFTSPTTKKRREIGLGSTELCSLNEARRKVATFRALILQGVDPKEQRDHDRLARAEAQTKQKTFKEAATQCIAARTHGWKSEKHKRQWTSSLEHYVYPQLGAQPVQHITTDMILHVLEPIWLSKTETASRVRQRIETVMDWCKARKLVSGDNPAALKGGLGHLLLKARKLTKVKHQPALPYLQVHEFVQTLRTKRGISPKALEFLIHTAARSGEILGAKWSEFDQTMNVWTIPAERMKAGREHRIPLNPRAQEILREMLAGKQCEYVFPGPRGKGGMSNGALLAVMKGMDAYASYVPHGMRSTFRDWAAETTNVANETLELALAHTIKDQAEAAYRRLDQLEKRTVLMKRWGTYIETKPVVATVTPIAASQRT